MRDGKMLVQREGYGLAVDCVVPLNGRDTTLRSTVIMDFDGDPALEERRKIFERASDELKRAVAACNGIRMERMFVFVDRTRGGIEDRIREQTRRIVVESGVIAGAVGRGNGVQIFLNTLSASVFDHDERSIAVAPSVATEAADEAAGRAGKRVETELDAWLLRPMGETTSALATTIASVLSKGMPAAGDMISVQSDFLENDTNTVRLSLSDLSQAGDFRNAKVRVEIKQRLQRILELPPLVGVRVDLHLLPVAGELARMLAMARVFEELFEERGAAVTIHIE
jgi:hypothetical protein